MRGSIPSLLSGVFFVGEIRPGVEEGLCRGSLHSLLRYL